MSDQDSASEADESPVGSPEIPVSNGKVSRPSRQKALPSKLKDVHMVEESQCDPTSE